MNEKTIVVCGDLVWDTHVARLPSDPKGYFQPHFQTQMMNRYGGAWYLCDMVTQAIASAKSEARKWFDASQDDLRKAQQEGQSPEYVKSLTEREQKAVAWLGRFEAKVLSPEKPGHVDIEEGRAKSGGVARGFSVWQWFDSIERPAQAKMAAESAVKYTWKHGEALPGAWRIKEFLGCQAAKWPEEKPISPSTAGKTAGMPEAEVAALPEASWPETCPAPVESPQGLCLAVVDDLGLGFADREQWWPKYLIDSTVPVVARATPPFDRPLWRKLLAGGSADRLTIVVSAAALRDAGARLTRGLSWDQTIQDVKREFSGGGICWPLRRCRRVVVTFGRSGAAVFSRSPRPPAEKQPVPVFLQFERFVFDPAHLEDTWGQDLPGTTFGATSVMTAAIAAHLLADPQPSSHRSVSRGLAAARALHLHGGGRTPTDFNITSADTKLFAVDTENPPEKQFRSGFPRELLDEPVLFDQKTLPGAEEQTLLTDAVGLAPAFLVVAAHDIVRYGRDRALASVPRLLVGDYFTVDREEIERLNLVRSLIYDYQHNPADKQPLSLAVLGPPGAGKGFAIEELCKALLGKETAVLKFNLSQFEGLEALHEAFHQVRDQSVEGKLPLVFWDEFDCKRQAEPLGWLKEFLAPMQDAKFVANGHAHPFGKCIFIFAGGTCGTFKEFIRPLEPDTESEEEDWQAKGTCDPLAKEEREQRQHFKEIKGRDFVSRLRGYVNIKGPNPASATGDPVYLIRRALMLRLLIERHHKSLVDQNSKEIIIAPTVVDAFLKVGNGKKGQGYVHGARSMEAIVSLSRLGASRRFGPSELPGQEVLDLHVTPDFLTRVQDRTQYHFSPDDIEKLAELKHLFWMKKKEAQGKKWGRVRDDHAKPATHPRLKPYSDLEHKEWKQDNRRPARLAPLRLAALGFRICMADHGSSQVIAGIDSQILQKMARAEHRRWMRQKLLEGVAWDGETDDALLLHKDICWFAALDDQEGPLDTEIVQAIQAFLEAKGLVLVKAES